MSTNFYILTGGPGSGKTTVLNQLKQQGFNVVEEVGRKIIKQQKAMGGDATHTGDRKAFCKLMLEESIKDYRKNLAITEPIFFDRGIPDLFGYSKVVNGRVTDDVNQAVNLYRYNSKVFLFPPWQEIYVNDAERKQDFQEAVETYHFIKQAYIDCRYQIIEMPKVSIKDRVTFILS